MSFVADENFPGPAIYALRQAGFDIFSIAHACASSPDQNVLSLSVAADRVLLTFDKDFGKLTYVDRLPATSGVILFRIDPTDTGAILHIMSLDYVWKGYFTVIKRDRIRRRALPQNRA